jgi:putative copper resistance protein D
VTELVGLVRAGHVAGTLSLFGSFAFLALILPAEARALLRLKAWILVSLAVALGFGALWLLVVAAEISGAPGFGAAPTVLAHTEFGRSLLARGVLLVVAAAAVLADPRRWLAATGAGLAGLAVVLQAGAAHAAALPLGEGLLARFVQIVHLLAAGLWLGGLVPLLAALHLAAPVPALAARRFSRLGTLAVAVLALSAVGNAAIWVGSLAALVGTTYGRWVLVKLALFAAMLLLAALNRWRLTPALAGAAPEAARRQLQRSVVLEAAIGVAIIAAAGILASTAPPAHHP